MKKLNSSTINTDHCLFVKKSLPLNVLACFFLRKASEWQQALQIFKSLQAGVFV